MKKQIIKISLVVLALLYPCASSAQLILTQPDKYGLAKFDRLKKQLDANSKSFESMSKDIDKTLEKSQVISKGFRQEQKELQELNLDGSQQSELIETTTKETQSVLDEIETEIEQKSSARRGFGKVN